MNTLFIVIILEYIGIPADAAKIIAFILYIAFATLLVGALISIINTATYTKKLNEQNEQIIAQNNTIISELKGIRQEQINTSQNQIKYMQFMTHKQQQ